MSREYLEMCVECLGDIDPMVDEFTCYNGLYVCGACAEEAKDTLVPCKFCGKNVSALTAHVHQGAYIGDDCCWDPRLASSQ